MQKHYPRSSERGPVEAIMGRGVNGVGDRYPRSLGQDGGLGI